jgi:hypothetical protein
MHGGTARSQSRHAGLCRFLDRSLSVYFSPPPVLYLTTLSLLSQFTRSGAATFASIERPTVHCHQMQSVIRRRRRRYTHNARSRIGLVCPVSEYLQEVALPFYSPLVRSPTPSVTGPAQWRIKLWVRLVDWSWNMMKHACSSYLPHTSFGSPSCAHIAQ